MEPIKIGNHDGLLYQLYPSARAASGINTATIKTPDSHNRPAWRRSDGPELRLRSLRGRAQILRMPEDDSKPLLTSLSKHY
jgi:hypothetical protein